MAELTSIAATSTQSGKSIKDTLIDVLKPLPKKQQLAELLNLFNKAVDLDEIISETVSEAWYYLTTTGLWSLEYPDLKTLQESICYEQFVATALKKHSLDVVNKQSQAKGILKNWGKLPQDALPDGIKPEWFGLKILRQLNSLSKICSLEESISLLTSAVENRLLNPKPHSRSNHKTFLTPTDVLNVLNQLKDRRKGILPLGKLVKHQADKQINQRLQQNQDLTSRGIAHPRNRLNAFTPTNARNGTDTGENHTAESGDEREDEDNDEVDGEEDHVGEGGDSDEADGREDEEEEQENEQTEVSRAGAMETKPMKELQCGCATICSALLLSIPLAGDRLGEEEGLKLLECSHDLHWANFCKNHLRRLAGGGLDMYTNVTKNELQKRLKLVFRYRADLSTVRTKKPRYFRRASRAPDSVTAKLGPYMYTPKKTDTFTFNAKQVFNRFAGRADAWDTFREDGTVNIDGVFDYILKPETFELIEEEFDMYLYHLRDEQDGQKRRGWMRHMFYSLVQQLVRQDPVYYALIAAARPDKNFLVEGESTGFAHLDINVDKFVKTGRGKNIIQGSLSLDDESEHSCTLLVPGFHRHIHEWWARVKQRGQDSSGYTTNTKKTYLPAGQQDFGRLIPVPCKRGAVRITMPEILHGSTPIAKNIRRTLFNWPTGIHADHQTLDIEEAETWNQVAQCHQSMEAPMKSTSGEGFRYGRPLFPFPGVTKLSSTSCVGDALIGVRRWDDIRVQEERDILLGADDEPALQLAEEIRERLIQAFFDAFPYVRMNEERAYQDRSYFRNKYGPRPEAERDESSLSSEELSHMSLDDNEEDMEEIEEGDGEFD
ncbi:MAG: hypothetical protein M1839_008921 [Geoglossum umbratile]|nr:MAG: hypothetical protein M1839_008921 [Geoglossum umbratile]